MDKYFLSPTVCISYDEKEEVYIIGNIFYKNSYIKIKDLKLLVPNEETIRKKIFVSIDKLIEEKNTIYNFLENQYLKRPLEIGYIETTSICPYKCKVCPKSKNDLIRKSTLMDIELFKKIAKEIRDQDTVTLHLFGDPFCDKEIYKRIEIVNNYNIVPSFSTNLVSINNIDLSKLKNLKIKYFTISVDSIYEEEFLKIRGKSSQESIEKSFKILKELSEIAEEYNCIEEIVVQAINLTINNKTKEFLKEYANRFKRLKFCEKPFIEFPLTDAVDYQGEFFCNSDDKVFIYNVIGTKLPFKCLKPWQGRQLGILSDGTVVPCCMSFNSTFDLGNINNMSIIELKNSHKFKEFRKLIWENKSVGLICDNCNQINMSFKHEKMSKDKMNILEKYCLKGW